MTLFKIQTDQSYALAFQIPKYMYTVKGMAQVS